jgi:glycosyltransferase involved in cell wall biosynthesis
VKEWNVRPLQAHFEVEPTIAAEHRLLKEVPCILANSETIVADLTRLSGVDFSSRATIVAHGTPDPFAFKPARQAMRKAGGKAVRLVYVGRFEHRKGFDIAALAFERLLGMNLNVAIEMVGDEVSAKTAASLASLGVSRLLRHEAARIGGILGREQLDDLLSSADVVVMPSRYESFGLVAIEAMAAGAPVVALRGSALSEVIEDGVSGRLVDADGNEVAAIVDVLLKLVRDGALRQALSSGARAAFERKYTMNEMICGVEGVFRAASMTMRVTGNS